MSQPLAEIVDVPSLLVLAVTEYVLRPVVITTSTYKRGFSTLRKQVTNSYLLVL